MIMVPGDTIRLSDLSFLDAAGARRPGRAGAGCAAARSARSVRARLHPQGAGGAARQHLADGRGARRRAQQPVPEDARVRHRAGAPRRGRGRAGIASGDPSGSIQEFGWQIPAVSRGVAFPGLLGVLSVAQLGPAAGPNPALFTARFVGRASRDRDQKAPYEDAAPTVRAGGTREMFGSPYFLYRAGPQVRWSARTREPANRDPARLLLPT